MAKTYSIKLYEEDGAKADLVIPEGFTDIGILTFCKARQKIKSVVFPSSMTELPEKLFRDCSHLQSVDLGNSKISVIPKSIFYGCKQLKQVILPSCVTEIDECAFKGCTTLTSINIPDGLIQIGPEAFRGCDSLQSINLPDSITAIGDWAFRYCKNLQGISLPDGLKKINEGLFYHCTELQNVSIPQGVKEIGDSAFFDCFKLKIDSLPNSVKEIGNGAFAWCTSINNFTVTGGVTKLGHRAFANCKSLQNISLPDSVTKIGEGTFEKCESLQSIVVPRRVTELSCCIFKDCDSLQNVIIPDSVSKINEEAFLGCKSLKNITLPNSITHIGESAFDGCESLRSIIIPDSVTTIGKGAFNNCASLKSIHIPDSVTEIGSRMLFGCNLDLFKTESAHFKLAGGLLIDKAKSTVISSAFSYLNEIEIPDGVKTIGESAFEECKSLQRIILPDSVAEIGELAFRECELLQSIILPAGIIRVRRCAFYDCDSLKSVTIENPKIEFGRWSFGDCDKLTTVNLPKGLSWTKIKDYFDGSPWGKMSPKAALAAQKEAEEKVQAEALRIKQEKVREMSAMASSFVIKQAFEVAFNSETSVKSDNGNQWFDIKLELLQGVGLQVRMPVVLKMEKLQVYTSNLVEIISKFRTVFNDVFAGQDQENNHIHISVSSFSENRGLNATIKLNLNNSYTKGGNRINIKTDKVELEAFHSSLDELANSIKNIDGFMDIRGEYELTYSKDSYAIALKHAHSVSAQVVIPMFVSEIGPGSFQGCYALTEISLPYSLKITRWPFSGCCRLKNINFY